MSKLIKIRVTPTEKEAYRAASGGNMSGWLKKLAAEKLQRSKPKQTTKTYAL